ncbi:Serine/threonine-protein kinase ppk25 [Nosema granulosis]|uniref:Serine/threonine-protein kinase ppk25 n=1 Tax=Nosema granulosis TaxID=83296 RepID=A0A9P6KYY1_9MICR|nr:Serine/threonine-protein kinase ppk25 [Nosema granulosis]
MANPILQLEKLISEGSYGKIYYAIDLRNFKPVAVKHLDDPSNKDEFTIHSLLKHKNIVEMYYCINDSYLVMERVEGCDLFDLIQEKKYLSEREARDIFMQVLEATVYLHQNLIIHRDIKPENILVSRKSSCNVKHNVKLCDFGFSCFYNKSSKLTTSCGSLFYAPPEMLRGEAYVGPEVDLWCLGNVLYMMVQGEAPIRKPGDADLEEINFHKEIRHFEWSRDLEDLIKGLLVEKDRRFTLEDVCRHPFIQFNSPLRTYRHPFRSAKLVEQIQSKGYPEAIKNVKDPEKEEFHIYNLLLEKLVAANSSVPNIMLEYSSLCCLFKKTSFRFYLDCSVEEFSSTIEFRIENINVKDKLVAISTYKSPIQFKEKIYKLLEKKY